MQERLFDKRKELTIPDHLPDLQKRLEESKEIVQQCITDTDPYAICLMLSGGDDSVTALQVAKIIGVKIDFIIHGVTGTGLKDVRKFVNKTANAFAIPLLEADAKNTFENYVKRKGFFGRGATAHSYSYHLLKSDPFNAVISKYLRKGLKGRKILLLNGVRIEESENRADNFADETSRWQKSSPGNLWVNIIHYWSKKECLQLLEAENIKRCSVACALGRSGECNCGTMQSEADIIAAANYDPDFKNWLWPIRKYAIEKFGWDICQQPNKKQIELMKQKISSLSDEMPMCVSCKAKAGTLF